MIKPRVALFWVLWLQGCGGTPTAPPPDAKAVADLIDHFFKARDSEEAAKIAAVWSQDGKLYTIQGSVVIGRDGIQRAYAEGFNEETKMMSGSVPFEATPGHTSH